MKFDESPAPFWQTLQISGCGGIRTHASEETGASNQLTTLILAFTATSSTTLFLQKHTIIVALQAASLYVQYTCYLQRPDSNLWIQPILSEFKQLPTMSEETTALPTNTDPPKTRRILDLFFPGRTQGHHTLLWVQQTADSHHITSRTWFVTQRYELPHFLQWASHTTRIMWINTDGAWLTKLLLT